MFGQSSLLFDAHDAIARFGLGTARAKAKTMAQRSAIDAAAAYLDGRDQPPKLLVGSQIATCLPHRDVSGPANA